MMELVDMRDLGSRAVRRWGSTPHTRTTSGRNPLHSFAPPFQIEPAALGFDLVGDADGGILKNFSLAVISRKSKTIYYLAIKMGAAGQDYKMNNLTAIIFMPIFAMYLQLPRIV